MKTTGFDDPMLREQLQDADLMEATEIGQDAVYNLIRAREERKAQLHKIYMLEMEVFKKVIAFVLYLFLLFTAAMLGWMFFGLLWAVATCAGLTVLFSLFRIFLNRKRRPKKPKT